MTGIHRPAAPLGASGGAFAVSARRAAWDRRIVAVADPALTVAARHWLLAANALGLLLLAGTAAAPLLLAGGLEAAGEALYSFYAAACHQWAFRSFFVLGPESTYGREQLLALGVDPFTFVGDAALGWKMAFCERNQAILLGLLLFGGLYAARWRAAGLRPASYALYAVLIAPMGLDGLTQLAGWRESTWELRLSTGLLFGLASGWLLYPRLQRASARGSA